MRHPMTLTLALALAACGSHETTATPRAIAHLEPASGGSVTGVVTFEPTAAGLRIVADVEGLEPGPHGFHIHAEGDCSAPDASSAGGHFAPDGSPHGAPTAPDHERHAGDLGNLEADATGRALYERVDPLLTLRGPRGVIGRAVIVHRDADDLQSQPSGAAGPRVACGVVMGTGVVQ